VLSSPGAVDLPQKGNWRLFDMFWLYDCVPCEEDVVMPESPASPDDVLL
jgi:hypothetical protein